MSGGLRLKQSSYFSVRGVSCRFDEGTLTLHGHVTTFYDKQIAQTLVRNMHGVRKVENRLSVAPW